VVLQKLFPELSTFEMQESVRSRRFARRTRRREGYHDGSDECIGGKNWWRARSRVNQAIGYGVFGMFGLGWITTVPLPFSVDWTH
jgi:hypothetical protein